MNPLRPTSSRWPRTSAPDPRSAEAGSSLLELVVTVALLAVVLATALGALGSVQRSEAFARGRTEALDGMRVTMARLTRELRQARAVTGVPTASGLEIETFGAGGLERVAFAVTDGVLVRRRSGGSPGVLQAGLATDAVFSYLPSPAQPELIAVTLRVRPPGGPEGEIAITSEVRLRNRGPA